MRRDRAWAGVVVMACALTACAEAPRDEAPVTPEREAVDVGWSGAVERPEPTLEAAPEESAESAEAATASDTAAADPVGGPRQQGRGGLLGALGGAGRGLREAEAAPAPAAPAPRRSGRGRAAGARARVAQPSPRPSAAPLPQNGVLASTFVGGRGAQARLEDLLDRGVAVGGEQVRLEAFDELGRLPYPVPAEEAVGLHAELERARLREAGERVHLQIALMARRGERPPRPRMDVRLVLDRSGSMHGDKWTHAIAAAHQLVNRLEAGDTFGLISYSDEASVDLAPARIGDRRAAHRAIDDLRPGGGTNLEAALAAARAHAPRRRAMNDVLLTVVVSDGVANVGQTNPQALGGMARTLFDERGVLTTSVGLGTDFDEDTMIALAREGSGSYHFVRRATDIGEILTDELEERAQAVAQALRLRVELGEGVVATRVYGSRLLDEEEQARVRRTEVATDARLARELGITRDRQRDEDRGLRIHLPSFRRGDQHVVLMELEVPPGTERARIARVSLDYKDLLSRGNRSAHADVEAERTDDPEAATASTRRPVKRTVLAFQAGDALQSAATHLERGDLSGARTLLAERQRLLSTASRLWNDRALAEDASLLERYDRVLAHAWPSWDSHSRRTMVMAMSFYGDRRMR